MRANELMEGQVYLLQSPPGPAVYRGRHSGQLTLDDGSQLIAHAGYLRFEHEDEGRLRVILVETGAGVIEPEKTKIEREREQEAKRIRMEQADYGARQFMEGLGFTPAADRHGPVGEKEYRLNTYRKETLDEVQLDDFSIGHLKAAIGMARGAQG